MTDSTRVSTAPAPWPWHAAVAAGLAVWVLVYRQLVPVSEALTALLPIDRHSHAGEAVAFFLYDVPKVLMLLALVVFAMGVVRTFFSPERTRALLSGRRESTGNVLAAALGMVTPFCSCSAVSLFIGFVSAGVPLGVTLSFLIGAPLMSEVGFVLLLGLVGWQVALTYLVFGFTIAVTAGWVLGRMRLEGWLQDWVRAMRAGGGMAVPEGAVTMPDRYRAGIAAVREIVGKVWVWILVGIGVGAAIHGYVPADVMARVMGGEAWWSVPAAVLLGIPMYTNAAGVIPIVEALLGKGAAVGTVMAFMMSVIALSLPEMLILRQVMQTRLIALFIAVVATGILICGYLFNVLF